MAFHIDIDEALVLAYLCHPDRDLTEADVKVLRGFLEELADTGEAFRNDRSRRSSPGSSHFEVSYAFTDSAGRLRHFRFILSDAAAAYGVLRVRFAEEL